MTTPMATDAGTNWAGNLRYRAAEFHSPESMDELRRLVASASRVRTLGTRHSFNTIADTEHTLVSVARLGGEPQIDEDTRTVTVGAGMRYGELAQYLEHAGYALSNLASLPHISVGGAIATGTHGSGNRTGSLAAAVTAIELVTAEGDLVSLERGHPDFAGAVVSLGALGVVTRVTLEIEPTYLVEQSVYLQLPWSSLTENLDRITGTAYSVSLFSSWRDPAIVDQVWLKRRPDQDGTVPGELFGAVAAMREYDPLGGTSPVNCTPQLAVPGPWLDRLPHFRLEFTPSSGIELQSEHLVPRHHAVAALGAIRSLSHRISPLLLVNEIRTVAADDLWLSSSYGTDVVGIHFTWLQRQAEVEELLPVIEAALAPFDARPHWGKLFGGADFRRLYPRLDDFRSLASRYDPQGAFRNDFLERHIFAR
ncbi:MAG TPA: FAD-binding protein [Glaciibacter sp.]|nr:FAD-binding protein [Glaciibacter sp.]